MRVLFFFFFISVASSLTSSGRFRFFREIDAVSERLRRWLFSFALFSNLARRSLQNLLWISRTLYTYTDRCERKTDSVRFACFARATWKEGVKRNFPFALRLQSKTTPRSRLFLSERYAIFFKKYTFLKNLHSFFLESAELINVLSNSVNTNKWDRFNED